MNREGLERFVATLEASDKRYAEKWSDEALVWEEFGIYERLAEHIQLDSGKIHLDVGCGLGNLLFRLKQKRPEAAIIGMDRNPCMMQGAARILGSKGHIVVAHGSLAFRAEQQGQKIIVGRQFDVDAERAQGIDILAPNTNSIFLILDDIRSHRVLNFILGPRKIDSASFVFPGTSGSDVYEAPFEIALLDRAGETNRLMQAMNETRRTVFEALAQLTKTNGRLILVERILQTDPDLDVPQA
ncbi:methyltransferase domain-containing protein [Candidatus Peregrinibacteria bacterium]|nr:methyltransferase domain-containing protein [Candidatus Peregrinibacteria bacterium]